MMSSRQHVMVLNCFSIGVPRVPLKTSLISLAVSQVLWIGQLDAAEASKQCFCLSNPSRDLFVYGCDQIEQRKGWPQPKARCLSSQTGRQRTLDLDANWQRLPAGCGECKPCVPDALSKMAEIIRGDATSISPPSDQPPPDPSQYLTPVVADAPICKTPN